MARPARKTRKTVHKSNRSLAPKNGTPDPSPEAIKAAEQVALSAFASGLKLAAAFGTVAAKTASLALASLATGADKFSELIKQEALASSRNPSRAIGIESSTTGSKRKRSSRR